MPPDEEEEDSERIGQKRKFNLDVRCKNSYVNVDVVVLTSSKSGVRDTKEETAPTMINVGSTHSSVIVRLVCFSCYLLHLNADFAL